MAESNVADVMGLLREVFAREDGPRKLLEFLTQAGLEEEVQEHLGVQKYQRGSARRGHRNGYKPRGLQTRVGDLVLQVPQVRGCEPYRPSMWGRWQRHERAVLVACAEMYYQGVSTRKVQEVLEVMCGGEISAMTVSRVAKDLDEHLAQFRRRSLKSVAYPYLQIDARYEHVRVEHRIVSQAVLVVIGFNAMGGREILSWTVGDSESEATWGAIFKDLKDRGLWGLMLVSSDAHQGIRAAMDRYFQGVAWQRCQNHFMADLAKLVGSKRHHELRRDLRVLYEGQSLQECLQKRREMMDKWGGQYPKVAQLLEESLESCLTVLSFPAEHRSRLRTTNMAESMMRVLRRRTAVVNVFPSRESCDRLIGALLLETHEKWLGEGQAWFNFANLKLQPRAPEGAPGGLEQAA
jgi:transposase-like protein